MSYNFNQFRKKQFNNYLTKLDYNFITVKNQSVISSSTIFKDKVISLEGENILHSIDNTNTIQSYYLKFRIYKEELVQKIIVRLKNTEKEFENIQNIETIEIESGDVDDFSIFEFVIAPNNKYNMIEFVLERESIDYTKKNTDGTHGRVLDMVIDELSSIFNVIDYINPSINNLGKLKQIGVQSVPGLLMSINGEAIRVGKTGIYEINNGINVVSIGFVVDDDEKNKNFILDYQY